MLENIGDPGKIATYVDYIYNLTSVGAAGVYDVWGVFKTETCTEIYECQNGGWVKIGEENCEAVITQAKILEMQFPGQKERRAKVEVNLKNVFDALKDAVKNAKIK
jgi:hypothetical protein